MSTSMGESILRPYFEVSREKIMMAPFCPHPNLVVFCDLAAGDLSSALSVCNVENNLTDVHFPPFTLEYIIDLLNSLYHF